MGPDELEQLGALLLHLYPRTSDTTGQLSVDTLPADVALLDEGGKLPNGNLSAEVPLLEDGVLPLGVIPFSIVPPFDILKSVQTFETHTSGTSYIDTEMSVPVTVGKVCSFRAKLTYAAASLVGARFSVLGPAKVTLGYTSKYSLDATHFTENSCDDYEQPASANASSASATGNFAIIEGILLPFVSGFLKVRFASAGGNLITVQAGSYLYTKQFYAAV